MRNHESTPQDLRESTEEFSIKKNTVYFPLFRYISYSVSGITYCFPYISYHSDISFNIGITRGSDVIMFL